LAALFLLSAQKAFAADLQQKSATSPAPDKAIDDKGERVPPPRIDIVDALKTLRLRTHIAVMDPSWRVHIQAKRITAGAENTVVVIVRIVGISPADLYPVVCSDD
jgi:hypothetical protein